MITTWVLRCNKAVRVLQYTNATRCLEVSVKKSLCLGYKCPIVKNKVNSAVLEVALEKERGAS